MRPLSLIRLDLYDFYPELESRAVKDFCVLSILQILRPPAKWCGSPRWCAQPPVKCREILRIADLMTWSIRTSVDLKKVFSWVFFLLKRMSKPYFYSFHFSGREIWLNSVQFYSGLLIWNLTVVSLLNRHWKTANVGRSNCWQLGLAASRIYFVSFIGDGKLSIRWFSVNLWF